MYCLGLLILTLGQALASCPHGWTPNAESCYHVSRDDATWAEAQKMCESHHGSHLARIETEPEEKFIESMLRDYHHEHEYWLGASDWTVEGEWMWEPEGTASFMYTNWKPGQPDNHGGDDNCLLIEGRSLFYWKDEDCHDRNLYVCEKLADTDPIIANMTAPPVFQTVVSIV
ncbi:perlucin-like [Pecten maximus]|uniref:perlucin-like n=1 Tax=Pecten maximus TaxID=6579 RepID=UPI001458918E|nr:perlucin-like [Pecten maximus]